MQPIIFRQARVQDAVAVAQQLGEYYSEATGNAPVGDSFMDRMLMVVCQAIEQRDATIWIAESKGRLISIVWVTHISKVPWPGPGAYRWAYITDAYTSPPYRGHGMGSRLMRRIQQWAQDEGLNLLILCPNDFEDRYRRLGFAPEPEVLVWHPTGSIRQDYANSEHSTALRNLGDDDEDWERLAKWFANPHVREFYREDSDIQQVQAKFGPRTYTGSRVRPRVILHDGIPIGYAQFYPLTEEEVRAYQLPNTIRWGGFDLLIGDKTLWGRGIGKAVIRQLLDEIVALGLSHVAIDTADHNLRAIALYQKMGFEMERVLKRWELNQSNVLMIQELH